MVQVVLKFFRRNYKRIINSIAFIPAITALCFLVLSFGMVQFDFSTTGKEIKSNLHWLSLKDASTARSICSAIVSGIISLAVFSFSMVMILLNQAASQMSNRILGKLIGNMFQQFVLGFYIGTIVYALFLLSTIRDINTGIYVPAISTYFLIALTVIDIFLFIYFLHYITQSVKYETIIHDIYSSTKAAIKKHCILTESHNLVAIPSDGKRIGAPRSGLFQGFDADSLLSMCEKEDAMIYFLYPAGTYLIEETPLLVLESKKDITDEWKGRLGVILNIERGQEIDVNYDYGMKQLMEIALKALSPGINDPGTAVISLHALGDLLVYRMKHVPETVLKDPDGVVRIIIKEKTFDELFEQYVLPIWDYGKTDRLIQKEMLHILTQLNLNENFSVVTTTMQAVQAAILEKRKTVAIS